MACSDVPETMHSYVRSASMLKQRGGKLPPEAADEMLAV